MHFAHRFSLYKNIVRRAFTGFVALLLMRECPLLSGSYWRWGGGSKYYERDILTPISYFYCYCRGGRNFIAAIHQIPLLFSFAIG